MSEKKKGLMAKRIVRLCIAVLVATAIWAMALKTLSAFMGFTIELSDVLTFVSVAFGGELLMCLMKRVFAKPTDKLDDETKG